MVHTWLQFIIHKCKNIGTLSIQQRIPELSDRGQMAHRLPRERFWKIQKFTKCGPFNRKVWNFHEQNQMEWKFPERNV